MLLNYQKITKNLLPKLDNVNTSRLLNSIILNVEPQLLEKKTFFDIMNFKIQQITVKLHYMKIKFLTTFIVVFLFQTNSMLILILVQQI